VSSRLSAASTRPATDWVASLSPWPEEFGLDRMRGLLERLGHPERRYPAIHVVGTNGKSTAARTIAALLEAEGRRAGAYTSPHVSGWAERIWVDGDLADFEQAVARIRLDAEAVGATQFEALTAAALTEFAEREVDVAVLEAGLGGRLDATNVVGAEVVLLTNVSLEHTEVLGNTTEQIAKEKLAVAHAARVVVVPDNSYVELATKLSPKRAKIVKGGALETAQAFLGRPVEREVSVAIPGRYELRSHEPLEIWDGAHNEDGARWLSSRLPDRKFVLVISILADKDAERMLFELFPHAKRVITTRSSNPRSLTAEQLAVIARDSSYGYEFSEVLAIEDPHEALQRARTMAGPEGAVLVTGSLYLLANLAEAEEEGVR
jgi:dihydrofolate synthase / folylpolyglutamate synthase